MNIDCDITRLDVPLIYHFLSENSLSLSLWARGISLDLEYKSINNSLCIVGYIGLDQKS